MISVIIPCYNVAQYISSTLDSVLAQTDDRYEIIAINDGSTDETLTILNKYVSKSSKLQVYDKPNGGVSSARNVGMQHAKGDFLLFLDGDDIIGPTLVAKLNAHCNDGTDYIIYGWKYEGWAGKTKPEVPFVSSDYISSYLLGEILTNVSTGVVRREIAQRNNIHWDENTHYGEDREFIVRCMNASEKFAIIPDVLFKYMYRETSAVHTYIFNTKRLTALRSVERLCSLLKGTAQENTIITFMKASIALSWRMYYKAGCTDTDVRSELVQFSERYMRTHSDFGLNKYSLFAYTMGVLYHLKAVFHIVVKL